MVKFFLVKLQHNIIFLQAIVTVFGIVLDNAVGYFFPVKFNDTCLWFFKDMIHGEARERIWNSFCLLIESDRLYLFKLNQINQTFKLSTSTISIIYTTELKDTFQRQVIPATYSKLLLVMCYLWCKKSWLQTKDF